MAVPLLDLTLQYASIRDEVDAAIREVVESQRFILGPVVDRLEQQIAGLTGSAHAIGCASGTDALLLALKGLELEPGAEVIVPSFTFFATAGAVWNAGLRPVFVEVDAVTFNVTAETVAAALSDRTAAIIVVHLFGQMAEMAPLMELAERHGLALIEDAAQAIGATQVVGGERRQAGSVGRAGCLSFFPTKNLGGFGDGGMIVTGDATLAERLMKLRVHGGRQMYHHEMVGTNSRLDALQAAVLSAKLPHLEQWTAARRANARYYDEHLSVFQPEVRVPAVMNGNEHVYNQYTLRVRRRDELRGYLDARGIGTGVYYPVGLHLQECFASLGYRAGDLPITEQLTGEVVSLPIYPELTEADLAEVVHAVEAFCGGRRWFGAELSQES